MSNEYGTHQEKEPTFHRIARGLADAVAEDREAQRILFELRMNPERYVYSPGQTPDTYTDFLFRTVGTPPHEPSARERALG